MSGFTFIEILAALGLFGLLMAVVAVVSLEFLKSAKDVTLRITRDQIVNQIRIAAVNKKSILGSLKKAENISFYNCVCGVGTCNNMQQAPFLPFTLYDASDKVISPAFYDDSGLPCDPATGKCSISVKTSFFAQCKPDFTSANQNPPATCNGIQAEFVAIMYTVEENLGTSRQKLNHLKAISGPAYSQVADLAPTGCL